LRCFALRCFASLGLLAFHSTCFAASKNKTKTKTKTKTVKVFVVVVVVVVAVPLLRLLAQVSRRSMGS